MNIKLGNTLVVVAFASGTVAKSTVAACTDADDILPNSNQQARENDVNKDCV